MYRDGNDITIFSQLLFDFFQVWASHHSDFDPSPELLKELSHDRSHDLNTQERRWQCYRGCCWLPNWLPWLTKQALLEVVTGWQQWCYKNALTQWLFTSFTQLYSPIKIHVCSYLPRVLDFDIVNYCNKKSLVFLSHFKTHIYTFCAITRNSANAPNQEVGQ